VLTLPAVAGMASPFADAHPWLTLDNIVKPAQFFGLCYNLTIKNIYKSDVAVDKAEYQAEVKWVTFKNTEGRAAQDKFELFPTRK
jgi:hypothetical protein